MRIKWEELTLDNIGHWPFVVRSACLVLTLILVLFLGFWFDIKPQFNQYQMLQTKEKALIGRIYQLEQSRLNAEEHKKEIQHINNLLQMGFRDFPKKIQVSGLLAKVSQKGVNKNLYFKLFKPGEIVETKYYIEIPIEMEIVGNYHQLVEFMSEIANLNKILTLHDFSLEPFYAGEKDLKEGVDELRGQLLLKVKVKTYHSRFNMNENSK